MATMKEINNDIEQMGKSDDRRLSLLTKGAMVAQNILTEHMQRGARMFLEQKDFKRGTPKS
jgi:hypothetical protein